MKLVKSLTLFFCVSFIYACEHLYTDLPKTDYGLYKSDGGGGGGNKFIFPKDTPAIDIYNCFVYCAGYSVNSPSQSVTGTLKHTVQARLKGESVKLTHEIKTSEKNIQSVELTYSEHGPQIHEYTVIFRFIDNTEYRLCYKWQRQTTNVWQNDKLASAETPQEETKEWKKGEITFSDELTIQLS